MSNSKLWGIIITGFLIGIILAMCSSSPSSSPSKSSSSYSSSSSTRTTCQYKEGGKLVCSKTAMSGGTLCSTHYNYLDSVYKSITGG